MGIEFKKGEKVFYYSILNNFFNYINPNKRFCVENIMFSDFERENFKVYYGLYKLTIVPKNRGARFVLKIPFNRNKSCEYEQVVYEKAEIEGVENFFAPVELFNEKDYGIPIYIQRRAKPFFINQNLSEAEERYQSQSSFYLSDHYSEKAEDMGISPVLIDQLLVYYDEEVIEELIDFCQEHDVDDLHGANFGLCGGRPVIFDYAGCSENLE